MTGEIDPAAFSELLAHQRACRSYLPDPVDESILDRMLNDAVRAPSAKNHQPWQLVVVTDTQRRQLIWSLASRAWEHGGRQATEHTLPAALHADVDHGITRGFVGAPVSIVIGADLDRCSPELIGSSVFPAVQNLLLSAAANGLGSALTTISAVFTGELAEAVEFPATVLPVAVIPVGYPADRLGRSKREPVADHAHSERYGNAWEHRT
jgi:nitroreductase